MKTYLQKTKYQTYKYIRRVPNKLSQYFTITSIRVSLGAHELDATQTAISFNNAINEALQLIALNVEDEIIIAKLHPLLPQKRTEEIPLQFQELGRLKEVSIGYLTSQQDNISVEETRDKRYFYDMVCPAICNTMGLSKNPTLSELTYNNLLDFKAILVQLPKRNIHKYRSMHFSELLSKLPQVQDQDKLSARTVNKYIKWLRALFNFAVMLNHLQINLANSLPLQKTQDDKLQRLPLDEAELSLLISAVPHKMQFLLKVLANTGMRLSELYKCEITIIDNTKCFSLMNRNIKLKTKSSYRIIPVHPILLGNIENFEELRRQVSSDNLAKTTSSTIKKLGFQDKEKKSLYSLRHSFATRLIRMGADTSIVSELMGHSHITMTLSRYSAGFSVEQLKDVIMLL